MITLPTGVQVYNLTPHPLHFWCGDNWVITCDTDVVVNAMPISQVVQRSSFYNLVHLSYAPTQEGEEIIQQLRKVAPDALLVGSVIAAQAYPGEVVAPIGTRPSRSNHSGKTSLRLVRSDKFSTFNSFTTENK